MRSLSSVTVLMMLCCAVYADASWLQGRWQWDREATLEKMSHGIDHLRGKLDQLLPSSGQIWHIQGDSIAATQNGETLWESQYTISEIEDGRYELVPVGDELESRIELYRNQNGFCYTYANKYTDGEPSAPECYTPADA